MLTSRSRFRDTGLSIGSLPTGPHNAITDIKGVRVGQVSLIEGSGPLSPGKGPIRTGVTVILPHPGNVYRKKVRAMVHSINGHGKCFGFEQVRELGLIETPIALTNTFNVGRVADALIDYCMQQDPDIGVLRETLTLNVIVGETNDSYLNDLPGRHVTRAHVLQAADQAQRSADFAIVQEGSVGAGTGTICYGWKGGIGTASRVLPEQAGGYTVGTLVQSNFGRADQLTICGVPVGRYITPQQMPLELKADKGSIMIVLATDAPLSDRQLLRLCKRVVIGLACTGGQVGPSSGEFVIAFSTANQADHIPPSLIAPQIELVGEMAAMPLFFQAVVETVQEAVLNSMFCSDTMVGRDDRIIYGLPLEIVVPMVKDAQASLSR